MRRLFSPVRLLVAGIVLAGVFAGLLWAAPSIPYLAPGDRYIFLPDHAHPVAPLVTVKGGKDPHDGGGIYFVDVIVRKARLFDRIFKPDGSTFVPAEQINPPGLNDSARRQVDLRAMARSQEIAGAVALQELGYKVGARPAGAIISAIRRGFPAEGKLQPGETIIGADGKIVRTPGDLRRLIQGHRPGEQVRLRVRSTGGVRVVTLRTVSNPEEPAKSLIGVEVAQAADIKLPLSVRIDSGNIGGPSAGLAFALDVLEELGRDVDHGYKVAATGELELDGTVASVGGLKQKTIGARRTHVDVMLVPAGENAQEARRYAGDLKVLPVSSFRQALQLLATLPPKR